MSVSADDPRCPECGEPIGMTSAYCIHCSADLTEDRERTDTDADWDPTSRPSSPQAPSPTEDTAGGGSLLDPDGLLDTLLTVVVGLIGGVVISLFVWFAVTSVVSFGLGAAVGVLVWLGATAKLFRCRTVQEAVSKAAYGIAIAMMLVPLIVFSSTWDPGTRGQDFVILAVICAVPAAIAGSVGFIAARFVPESGSDG